MVRQAHHDIPAAPDGRIRSPSGDLEESAVSRGCGNFRSVREKESLTKRIRDFIVHPSERTARADAFFTSGAFFLIDDGRSVTPLGDRAYRANPHDRARVVLGAIFISDFYHINPLHIY
jgi:hypothetical protein